MKAISLWQPWASLWLTSAKTHETRHWPTRHRGPLLVHAAKRKFSDCGAEVDKICIRQYGSDWLRSLPRGAIVGVVNLEDCIPTEDVYGEVEQACDDLTCGDFSPGRYAWRRGAFGVFGTPVLWTGRQGLFDVDSEAVEAEALRLLGKAKAAA